MLGTLIYHVDLSSQEVSLDLVVSDSAVMEMTSQNRLIESPRTSILCQSNPPMPRSDSCFEVIIENVVACANLHQSIDLESIARILPTAQYKPDQFPGLVYRLRNPQVSVLVFRTGKLVVAGAKSENKAKRAVLKLIEELKTSGIVILGKPDTAITNIVASANLNHRIDLEDAANSIEGTIYEPDQFPGLIYRSKDPKVAILIFSSGKLVCAGASSEADVLSAINKLHEVLVSRGLMANIQSLSR